MYGSYSYYLVLMTTALPNMHYSGTEKKRKLNKKEKKTTKNVNSRFRFE